MTIATTQSSVTDQGNGATTLFNYNFLIPSSTDDVVTVTDTTVSPAITTTLTASQYVITGIDDPAGGTVQYPTSGPALAAGFYITISRVLPFIQTYQISNQGDFYPQVVEAALDYQMMCIQQLSTQIAAASFPDTFLGVTGQSPIMVSSSGGQYVVSLGPITASSISAGAVTTAKIADGAATLAKLDRTGTSASVLTAQGPGSAPIWASLAGVTQTVPVRQTVLQAAVDSSGLPTYITAGTGLSANIAATTVNVIVTAANAFSSAGANDRIGAISTDTSISLTANSDNYLYADVASNGTCTLGATTLVPAYQWAGAYSVTNGQFTFNVQEMTGKVGNGATSTQTYRVFMGVVTTNGTNVTAVIPYGLMGRFFSAFTATLPGTATSVTFSHRIGTQTVLSAPVLKMECTSSDNGYAVGDQIRINATSAAGSPINLALTGPNIAQLATGTTSAFIAAPKTGGAYAALTAAKWKYAMAINRGW